MIIRMKKNASEADIATVEKRIVQAGLKASISRGESLVIIGVIGDITRLERDVIAEISGVEEITRVSRPYKLVSREFNPTDKQIKIRNVIVGKGNFTFIAGPCAVESRDQMLATGRVVKKAQCQLLRGGAYKPRTNPYSFQGLGEEGLQYLKEASVETGLPIVTEVTGADKIEPVMKYADVIQIGTRNMRSYDLLQQIGEHTSETQMPVLLKRGDNATIEEFLSAAEYIAKAGNENIILCLRGIRTFESGSFIRNTADIGIIPVLKKETGLPVIFDPSHAAGKRDIIPSYSLAAVAAGADGLIIETHYSPQTARCDGEQSLSENELNETVSSCRNMLKFLRQS